MKILLKYSLVLMILFFAVFFLSCEKNLYDEPLRQIKRPNISVGIKQVTRNSEGFLKLKNKFPAKFLSSDNARDGVFPLTLEGEFGIVKLENVLEVIDSNDKSYSFEIKEAVTKPNEYLNLVIDKNNVIWIYKMEKLLQQYKEYPVNTERLVRYKLNNDFTQQETRPCDTIHFPPFQPDPINYTPIGGGAGGPIDGSWQNTPINGGFFPPIVIPSYPGSLGNGGGGGDGEGSIVEVFIEVADAIATAWNWLINLFSGSETPGFNANTCPSCNKRNAVVVALTDNPCEPGGYIAIYPQSVLIDKIYELDALLGSKLGNENKNYFYYNNGLHLDYFLNLVKNPPANFDAISILPIIITNVRITGNFNFAQWANNYLINHPEVNIKQFKNWFMTPIEGKKDFEYDEDFWENPSLTFPQRDLPSFKNFNSAYPKNQDGSWMEGANNVFAYVGGDVQQARITYPIETNNTCALKVSIALNGSGISIPNIPNITIQGGGQFANQYFFLSARALNKWMRKTFGTTTNSNYMTIPASQIAAFGENLPTLLANVKGIYSLVCPLGSNWASGHADIINNTYCAAGCHFQDAPIEYIDIWKLN